MPLLFAFLFGVFSSDTFSSPLHSPQYKIIVDQKDLSRIAVEIRIHTEKSTVRLAMAAHPEYDDRYFRFIEDFSAESGGRKLTVSRPEEAMWQIEGTRGDLTVRYLLRLPAQERAVRDAWKPFLTPTGGMVGDLHTLMYVVGEEDRRARLTIKMPAGWKAVSGLDPTGDPLTFAGSVELLLDSPVMIGDVKEWKFNAGGVPHTVAIWSPPDAKHFDAAPIVEGIEKLANGAVNAFGKPPYPRYTFLLQYGGQAALEHLTSVNIGLSPELSDLFQEIAHEYIHVWNLMDVRPRERVGIRYRFAEPTGVLWWNEGATIMFADLLIRRAGVPGERRSRIERLESVLARYLSAPGYSTLSAELVSKGDSHPQLLGNSSASTHLQGEALSTMLDLKIRDATDNRRNATDVMQLLSKRFDYQHGIGNIDIENAIVEVCGCKVDDFFRQHIFSAGLIDFDNYLRLIGLKSEVKWSQAVDGDGKPVVDLRIGPVSPEGEMKLRITNPKSIWAMSGLRTGDKTISADGNPVTTWQQFRGWLRTLKAGDVVRLVVSRDGETKTFDVPIRPFDVPYVRITENSAATPKQLRIREAWINAN